MMIAHNAHKLCVFCYDAFQNWMFLSSFLVPCMAYASTQEPNPATIVAQCPGRQSRVDKGERLKVTYFGP